MTEKSKLKLQNIDFALLCKLCKTLEISPKNWEKIMSIENYNKREVELAKFILKNSLPDMDDVVYRIREQKYGGLSITVAGSIPERLSTFLRNENSLNELRNFYNRTARALEFNEVYNAFVERRQTFSNSYGYIMTKDNGIYSRLTPDAYNGVGYRPSRYNNRNFTITNYFLLYEKLLQLIAYITEMLNYTVKLIEFESEIDYDNIVVTEELHNYHVGVDDLTTVDVEYVNRQLQSMF